MAPLHPKGIIVIDGKTIKGAKANGKKSPVHMVSAWANQNNLVLGQVKVLEKSNLITAIPQLLEVLSIKGTIVRIGFAEKLIISSKLKTSFEENSVNDFQFFEVDLFQK